MSIKLQFLHFHLEHFPENLGDYIKEQGERFHQDIKEREQHYEGRWDEHMMADYDDKTTRKRRTNYYHGIFCRREQLSEAG